MQMSGTSPKGRGASGQVVSYQAWRGFLCGRGRIGVGRCMHGCMRYWRGDGFTVHGEEAGVGEQGAGVGLASLWRYLSAYYLFSDRRPRALGYTRFQPALLGEPRTLE